MESGNVRVVDLFSGCGGFSQGARQAGFEVAAAFDNDPVLTWGYSRNFPHTQLVLADLTKVSGAAVTKIAGGEIGGVLGGPPCQGFSDMGRRDPADPRRRLLGHFFRIISETRPGFFVMENVRGLGYSSASEVLGAGIRMVEDGYNILGPSIWSAAEFGAATTRSRLFVVGIRKDWGEALSEDEVAEQKRNAATVRAAIADLDDAESVDEEDGLDVWRITRRGRPFEYARVLRAPDRRFTGHRVTVHSREVRERFESVPEGGFDDIGRHPRLAWLGQCPAIRAGTGADRGRYQAVRPIHPRLPRVITVREAARLQGFPDMHRFHPTLWHSFRMIGNSVSPIMANALFEAIKIKIGTMS